LVFVVNKNVDFSHFANFTLIRDYHSVFEGEFKVDYVVYVTTQGDYHRSQGN